MTPADRNEPDPEGPPDGVEPPAGTPAGPATRRRWRVGTPLVVLLSGALFAVSATNSDGTDLRPGRYTSLTDLTDAESRTYEQLESEARALAEQVDQLTRQVDDVRVRRVERRAQRLRAPAGLEPVDGRGLRIVMSDASDDRFEELLRDPDATSAERDLLVVHQEDLQNVLNALWAGGATAVTVQGQRVITTTGIKCSGSAVQLGGVPYPQPYTIEAVGDPAELVDALDDNERVTGFRADADNPDVGVGWELSEEDRIEAPGYDGLLDIDVAKPRRDSTG